MAQPQTELQITIYSGVPFNNKYQNVLFVNKEQRETFLDQYKVGQAISQNRFEIINETEQFFDITLDYNCFEANYLKVHTTIVPETNPLISYQRDTFYFVNSVRQLGNNVCRVYLEIDIFQTFFNKYDFNSQQYLIPEIKKSRCTVSTDFTSVERNSILEFTNMNSAPVITEMFPRPQNQTYSSVRAVAHFLADDGEYVMISQHSYKIYNYADIGLTDKRLEQLLKDIYASTDLHYYNVDHNIQVVDLYLVPDEIMDGITFTNIDNTYNFAEAYFHGNSADKFYISTAELGYVLRKTHVTTKTVTPVVNKQTSIGNFAHQIELPYNSKTYDVNFYFTFANTFQLIMQANNQTIDITSDFKFSIVESSYGTYLQQHENGLFIKSVANAVNLLGSGIGLATGNPASIISMANTITGTAGEIASLVDLKNQPLKLNAESQCVTSLVMFNMIGVFTTTPANSTEIENASKFMGYRMNYLTDKSFVFIPDPVANVRYNFDYYKFSNVEIVGKIPENHKQRIEQMFLDGVRVWYSYSKFLQTIEPRETLT